MKENLFQKTEKTLYDYKNLDLRIANIGSYRCSSTFLCPNNYLDKHGININ
ncbi:hypothetical protein [Clostridium botulinum]|uniref:hypothetical protein n=1 Tax=Clostridium botulinum TaxID=1491 RepID=UPI000A85F0E6|nr:hypothetical protein [Clostridium botulinum]